MSNILAQSTISVDSTDSTDKTDETDNADNADNADNTNNMKADEIEQKHKKLEELAQKFRKIQPNPLIKVDRHHELRKIIIQNRRRIQKFINMCNAIGSSNQSIQQYLQQLEVTVDDLKKLQQEPQKDSESWFKCILLAIPRLIQFTIKIIFKAIAYILSLGFYDMFEKEEKELEAKLQTFKSKMQSKRNQKQLIEGQIKGQMSSKKYLIEQLRKFEKNELPKIEEFLKSFEQAIAPNSKI